MIGRVWVVDVSPIAGNGWEPLPEGGCYRSRRSVRPALARWRKRLPGIPLRASMYEKGCAVAMQSWVKQAMHTAIDHGNRDQAWAYRQVLEWAAEANGGAK